MTPKILAIIPCYNEESNIKTTVDALLIKAPDIDFVIINDGSRDATHKVCIDNNYPVIDMPFNLGLANAVQTGMRYAYSNNFDMALQYDGDGQHMPDYIEEMIVLMQKTSADIVIGSRYMQKNSRSLRRFGGILIKVAIKVTTGKTLTDPTSGMRLFNRKMIEKFAMNMNYGPEPDTLAYLMKKGIKVVEAPIVMQKRRAGRSYLNALNAANYMLRMFVSIIIVHWFRGEEKKL